MTSKLRQGLLLATLFECGQGVFFCEHTVTSNPWRKYGRAGLPSGRTTAPAVHPHDFGDRVLQSLLKNHETKNMMDKERHVFCLDPLPY